MTAFPPYGTHFPACSQLEVQCSVRCSADANHASCMVYTCQNVRACLCMRVGAGCAKWEICGTLFRLHSPHFTAPLA